MIKRSYAYCIFAAAVLLTASLSFAEESCVNGERRCSSDAYSGEMCENGERVSFQCMSDKGMLCENGECVAPWNYGRPSWPTAEQEQLADGFTLAEKASRYEDRAKRLHVHPELKWMMGLELPCGDQACIDGDKEACEKCVTPSISEDEATWKDVSRWRSGENDGLFSALYLAAEAFRYASTKDPEALEMVKLLLDGEVTRMKITGVPGLFTRQYVPPGINGLSCPSDDAHYVVDVEKDDNKWVKVDENGCIRNISIKTGEWETTEFCVGKEFAGWCWLDNVSKDEYSGHMFALGAVAKLVDDPEAQAVTKDLLYQVGKHMIVNKMAFTDWDGRIAEHGRVHAVTLGDYPGFNAAMGLDFMKVAAEATGDEKFKKWYSDCLLQKSGKWSCIKKPMEKPTPYYEYFDRAGLYPGPEGCMANFNNVSMHMLSVHNLIWFENDPEIKEIYQEHLDKDVFRPADQPRAIIHHNNAFFDFIWASQKKLGPNSDGSALDVVENGIRMLKQFPASQRQEAVECPQDKCKPYCLNRFKRDEGGYPREVKERCAGTFMWWGDPYSLGSCATNQRVIHPPTDYLLAYWMGRYYGFIPEDM